MGRRSYSRRCVSGDRGAAVLRPDQARERPRGSRAGQHPREKTWRTSGAAREMSGIPGEGEETPGARHGRRHDQPSLASAMLTDGVFVGPTTECDYERSTDGCAPGRADESSSRRWTTRTQRARPILSRSRPRGRTRRPPQSCPTSGEMKRNSQRHPAAPDVEALDRMTREGSQPPVLKGTV